MNALNIEIFSDLICPWCYIGRRRLEAGLKILGANELPNIIWHPFELNPDMPKGGTGSKGLSFREIRELGTLASNGSRSRGDRQDARVGV
jgi:predicted DsbA family dithiol-disulfide isomerase